MLRRCTLFFAFVCLPALHAPSWAEPFSDDVIGRFILTDKAAAAGVVLGARHKASARELLDTQPRLSLFGRPSSASRSPRLQPHRPAPPSIDSYTLMMSDVVVTAMGYLGKPYVYGESSLNGGFDCSGFVLSLYQRTLGHTLPRTAADQARATEKISKNDLSPGDLVFFKTTRRQFSHVGIYIGEGRFIHSPRAGSTIRIESMEKAYWQKRFNGARRVLPETQRMASAA